MDNYFALPLTFGIALAWLRANNFAAQRGWVESGLSRKIIHMGTGPLFVLCWLLFSNVPSARWLAALVPFAITVQFALVGTGVIKDPSAVRSMSRSGDRKEILRGPLFYGIVFVLITLLYWYDHPAGIVALMLLCGGDGLADIWGRKYGKRPVPWNKEKTLAGSLGMLVGGWLFAIVILGAYVSAGIFPGPLAGYLLPVTLIALVGTLVESLPFSDIDNITVTAAALLLGHFLLPAL
jgi:phytol kinase